MKEYKINTKDLKDYCEVLRVGDKVYLSGTVFTARDAAHKRIFEYLESNRPLPFEIKNSVIYYAGPTPTPKNLPIGSCGPTTSKRMDFYTPKLLDLGLLATIGKGQRNADVTKAITKNRSVYLCAIGGAGALAAKCIKNCEVIAFDDLGCESIKKLELEDFPLIVGIDCLGNSIYEK